MVESGVFSIVSGDRRKRSTALCKPGEPLGKSDVPLSDEALAEGLIRGEAGAFEEILTRYRDKIFQFIRWYSPSSRDEAEDVAQEVFVQVYRSGRSFQNRSRLRTWLYSIARNVCRHQARKRRRSQNGQSETGNDGNLPEIPDSAPDPLARLELQERRQLTQQALARLTPRQRTVLMLREWEEMSYQEIADLLRIPIGTVRSRIYNARCALAAGLALPSLEDDRAGKNQAETRPSS